MNPGFAIYQMVGHYMNYLNSLHLSILTGKTEHLKIYTLELLKLNKSAFHNA